MTHLESTIPPPTEQGDEGGRSLRFSVKDAPVAEDDGGRLRLLATQLALLDERDRRRLARAIHDDISQPLAMAMMLMGFLQKSADAGGKPTAFDPVDGLKKVRDLLTEAIEQTRSIASELSPALLYEVGLIPALEGLAEQARRRHGIHAEVSGELAGATISIDASILLYQMVRELLSNVVRHAHAAHAWVTLVMQDPDGGGSGRGIRVEVRDDGVGMDAGAARENDAGLGLFNVKTTLDQIGGRFTMTSSPGAGTTIQFWAPLLELPQPTSTTHTLRRHL